MTSRKTRARIATETVEILKNGRYKNSAGKEVSVSSQLKHSKKGTRHYSPEQLNLLLSELARVEAPIETKISVEGCTTLEAARKLLTDVDCRPLCLNFASAKHPGGGFLNGSQAQEESLARASGLYASINPIRAFYEINRECETSLYTHHMIYSPDVPVFRNDDDEFLEAPYLLSMVTAPAVNAGAVKQNEPDHISEIGKVMQERIKRVLAIATAHQHDSLVLGAWGCGVFRNEPREVARWFCSALKDDSYFAGRFRKVIFAVYDKSEGHPILTAFADVFKDR